MSNHRNKIACLSLFVLLTSGCQAAIAEDAVPGTADGTVKLETYRRNDPVSVPEKAKRKFSRFLSMVTGLFLGMDGVHHYDRGQEYAAD